MFWRPESPSEFVWRTNGLTSLPTVAADLPRALLPNRNELGHPLTKIRPKLVWSSVDAPTLKCRPRHHLQFLFSPVANANFFPPRFIRRLVIHDRSSTREGEKKNKTNKMFESETFYRSRVLCNHYKITHRLHSFHQSRDPHSRQWLTDQKIGFRKGQQKKTKKKKKRCPN